jgi:hypothetical protein
MCSHTSAAVVQMQMVENVFSQWEEHSVNIVAGISNISKIIQSKRKT